jgi:hypothetical protein
VSFRPGPAAANVKLTTTAKAPEPASPQPTDHTGLIEKSANSTISSTPEAPPPDRLAEISDTVLKNAKTTIAAKMENPASVEFREMKRAERKNAVGKPIDSICGYVRGSEACDVRYWHLAEMRLVASNVRKADIAFASQNVC